MTDKAKDMTFVALNMPMPSCPHCACIRLQDWGEAINIMAGASAATKANDANLRSLAARHGLTDMSNKDGKSIKANARAQTAPLPQQFGGQQATAKLSGIDVPFGSGCVNVPGMARKLTAPSWRLCHCQSGRDEAND